LGPKPGSSLTPVGDRLEVGAFFRYLMHATGWKHGRVKIAGDKVHAVGRALRIQNEGE